MAETRASYFSTRSSFRPRSSTAIDPRFNYTMGAGASLFTGATSRGGYVLVEIDTIREYDRMLDDLKEQLRYYERVIDSLLPVEPLEEYLAEATNTSSVRLIDSIVRARVPDSAPVTDLSEDEGL